MAVDLQATRSLDPSRCFSDRLVDAVMFVGALRNLLRAIAFASEQMNPIARESVRVAQDEFQTRVPNAKDVRDGLEHFDDYEQGKGKMQQKQAWPFRIRWQNTCAGVLSIGPGRELGVADARDAAMDLHRKFAEAHYSQSDTPHS